MQTNLEQVTEIIKSLPLEDFDRVREVLDSEERSKLKTNGNHSDPERDRFQKTQKWLEENRERFLNQWVCLDGDKLIAHGIDALEVDRKAKSAGIEAPFLEHIVDEKYPFGGW